MNSPDVFDEKYFEDGVRNRISAYENYRWIPERTIREATSIIKSIAFKTVLDYGCAKGFMVHAMRLLGKEAYGADVSKYAVENCHPKVKNYLQHITETRALSGVYDLIMAKDVLEHVTKEDLPDTLQVIKEKSKTFFCVVPLGDNGRYRIREYEMDATHIIREPEEWWLTTLVDAGFKIRYFDYEFGHLKEHWTSSHPFGNAFIIAE